MPVRVVCTQTRKLLGIHHFKAKPARVRPLRSRYRRFQLTDRQSNEERTGTADAPVMDFVIIQCDVILVDGMPLLQLNFLRPRSWNAEPTTHKGVVHEDDACGTKDAQWKQNAPICAAISFLRSPTVSSWLHFTRTFRLREEEGEHLRRLIVADTLQAKWEQ